MLLKGALCRLCLAWPCCCLFPLLTCTEVALFTCPSQAQALLLLERYGEAEEAAQGGLDEMEGGDSKDPLREELRSVLAACQAALEGGAAGAAAAAAATPDVPAGEPSCSRKRCV